jgi:N-acyl-D-aspartate/D-glutamate deacylase
VLDTIFKDGLVVDGTGGAPRRADVGVKDGRITAVGRLGRDAAEIVDADGCLVTPGFVDLHTHYDGEVTWDAELAPSVWHGVTTVVMGNCGVGFAPVERGREAELLALMEGVEDIPGSALAEGIDFRWQSFGEYLDVLAARHTTVDVLAQVPHDPLRLFVMRERGKAREPATSDEVARMRALLREALLAGAAGFTTGRSDNHRTSEGLPTPASEASAEELVGIARAFEGLGHGVVQVVSDFDLLVGAERFDAEFDVVEATARAAGRPLSASWMQRWPGTEQWRRIAERTERAVASGLDMKLQCAPRGIGVLIGLGSTFHPLVAYPSFWPLAGLPPAECAARLREPALRARILSEAPSRQAGDGSSIPPLVDVLLEKIEMIAWRFFPLDDVPDYEPSPERSVGAMAAARGVRAIEVLYDLLAEGDGSALIYFPIFNYVEGSLDAVGEMLHHPRALWGLSDAGAHVGTICDASSSTTLLAHWARDRARDRLPLETAIAMLTSRNARHLGLVDRGVLAPGLRADLNVIELARLGLDRPYPAHDLPAGGRRLLQRARGYVGTWVGGVRVAREGALTGELPGRLVRLGR